MNVIKVALLLFSLSVTVVAAAEREFFCLQDINEKGKPDTK